MNHLFFWCKTYMGCWLSWEIYPLHWEFKQLNIFFVPRRSKITKMHSRSIYVHIPLAVYITRKAKFTVLLSEKCCSQGKKEKKIVCVRGTVWLILWAAWRSVADVSKAREQSKHWDTAAVHSGWLRGPDECLDVMMCFRSPVNDFLHSAGVNATNLPMILNHDLQSTDWIYCCDLEGKGYWLKLLAMHYLVLYLSFMVSLLCGIYCTGLHNAPV